MDQTHTSRSWAGTLKHRWPTALGLTVAVLLVLDLRVNAEFVSSISSLVMLIALVYLGSVVLNLRWVSWVILLVGLTVIFIPADFILSGPMILLIVSLVFVIAGVVRGQLSKPDGFTLQTVGMLVFGLTALATLYVNVELGAYLVAFALLGHAVWDALHFIQDRVVARSYAEFCVFVDLLVGVAILYYLLA